MDLIAFGNKCSFFCFAFKCTQTALLHARKTHRYVGNRLFTKRYEIHLKDFNQNLICEKIIIPRQFNHAHKQNENRSLKSGQHHT